MNSKRKPLTAKEFQKFIGYAKEIFERLGLDKNSPGTAKTPERWLKAMIDMTAGYEGDPNLKTIFPNECQECPDEQLGHIVEGPIQVISLCEHHCLPIWGRAWVGYLAGEQIIGISKFVRLMRLYSCRLTTQERIIQENAGTFMKMVKPRGVAVYIEAHHFCSIARGVKEANSHTTTFATRGLYLTEPRYRDEFLNLLRSQK